MKKKTKPQPLPRDVLNEMVVYQKLGEYRGWPRPDHYLGLKYFSIKQNIDGLQSAKRIVIRDYFYILKVYSS